VSTTRGSLRPGPAETQTGRCVFIKKCCGSLKYEDGSRERHAKRGKKGTLYKKEVGCGSAKADESETGKKIIT